MIEGNILVAELAVVNYLMHLTCKKEIDAFTALEDECKDRYVATLAQPQKFNVGDLVEIVSTTSTYFKAGDFAVLKEDFGKAGWSADFDKKGLFHFTSRDTFKLANLWESSIEDVDREETVSTLSKKEELPNLFKPGDKIEILTTNNITNISTNGDPYYSVGDIGTLLKLEDNGGWKVDFSGNGNKEVLDDGIWWVSQNLTTFKLVTLPLTTLSQTIHQKALGLALAQVVGFGEENGPVDWYEAYKELAEALELTCEPVPNFITIDLARTGTITLWDKFESYSWEELISHVETEAQAIEEVILECVELEALKGIKK